MEKNAKIFVAGHRGMVGSAIKRRLEKEGYRNIVVRTSKELDLRDQAAVRSVVEREKQDYVYVAAANVDWLHAINTHRAEFISDNIDSQSNIIHQSYLHGVKKLVFLGSSCIYPKFAPQPMKDEV